MQSMLCNCMQGDTWIDISHFDQDGQSRATLGCPSSRVRWSRCVIGVVIQFALSQSSSYPGMRYTYISVLTEVWGSLLPGCQMRKEARLLMPQSQPGSLHKTRCCESRYITIYLPRQSTVVRVDRKNGGCSMPTNSMPAQTCVFVSRAA